MRELFAHPLHRLNRGRRLFLLLATSLLACTVAYPLPLPVGPLSDYGSVLDRHGRERILALIEDSKGRLGIAVNILASWEDPYGDIDRYAGAILQAWGLGEGKTILAVFLKTKENWDVSVVGGAGTAFGHPALAQALAKGVADLVAHRRIEEAMAELFAVLERELAPPASVTERRHSSGIGRALWIPLAVGGGFLLLLFILRRICPRCGRILRIRERSPFGPWRGRDRVYYCRRCGYSRIKGGEG